MDAPNDSDERGAAQGRGPVPAVGVAWLLVALGGACGLSAAGGLAMAAAGRGAPPIALLLVPPGLVLLAAPLFLRRRTDRTA